MVPARGRARTDRQRTLEALNPVKVSPSRACDHFGKVHESLREPEQIDDNDEESMKQESFMDTTGLNEIRLFVQRETAHYGPEVLTVSK